MGVGCGLVTLGSTEAGFALVVAPGLTFAFFIILFVIILFSFSYQVAKYQLILDTKQQFIVTFYYTIIMLIIQPKCLVRLDLEGLPKN